MSKHPYPEHVVEAVAEAMGRSRTGEDWGRFQDYFIEHTHVALQALWGASRVETIDDIHDVPESAVVRDKTGFVAVGREHAESDIDYDDYPAHVIYWGDHDE